MANARLNKALLAKMAKKLKRPLTHVRVRISQRATRWNMTSEAAQVRWANPHVGQWSLQLLRHLGEQRLVEPGICHR